MESNHIHPMPHAILFPFPLQGHVRPAVHLAIKLASIGFTVTFVNTEFIDQQINKSKLDGDDRDMFSLVRRSGFDIRYTAVTDGFPLSHDRNNEEYWKHLNSVFPSYVDELIGNMVGSELDPPLTCLITDTFLSWSSNIAKKYELVNVSFWTQPAIVYSIYYHMNLLKQNGHFSSDQGIREDAITYIPGVPAIDFKDLPSTLQEKDKYASAINRFIEKPFEKVREADIILFNTVQELESETISALQHEQKVYSVGPTFASHEFAKAVPSSIWQESDCSQWLNTKPERSILYVSFGSLIPFGKTEILELAYALLQAEVNFLWVLPPHVVGSEASNFLPTGYEEEIKDKGLIMQWCNQVEVMSHPAIGGFLSHCGWNSTLESIWCGIPLLCFPLGIDQITNRKLIVDDWEVGINLCQSKSITREEAARNINDLICGEIADELRSNVSKMRKTLQNAIAAGGSIETNFNRFICDVKAKTNTTYSLTK